VDQRADDRRDSLRFGESESVVARARSFEELELFAQIPEKFTASLDALLLGRLLA